MSDIEHYKGTLKEVKRLKGETLEDQCKRIINKELDEFCDSYIEMLMEDYYEKYIVVDDTLYSIEKKELDPSDDVFNITKGRNGTFNFEVRYYNGGCCLSEAIEYAFKKLKSSRRH